MKESKKVRPPYLLIPFNMTKKKTFFFLSIYLQLRYYYDLVVSWIHRHPNVESFLHTLWTDIIYDQAIGLAVAHIIDSKDFSREAIYALGYSLFRTVLRAVRNHQKEKKKIGLKD